MATKPGPQWRDTLPRDDASLGSSTLARAVPTLRAVLRIGAGLLFMQHGAQKLLGWFGGFGPGGGTAELFSQMGLAGVLELGGGLLIVLGLLTRPVAVILFIEMLWAYVQAHLPQGIVPIQNGGELALLYAVIWLYLAGAGPGAAALDHVIGGRTRRGAEPRPD